MSQVPGNMCKVLTLRAPRQKHKLRLQETLPQNKQVDKTTESPLEDSKGLLSCGRSYCLPTYMIEDLLGSYRSVLIEATPAEPHSQAHTY